MLTEASWQEITRRLLIDHCGALDPRLEDTLERAAELMVQRLTAEMGG